MAVQERQLLSDIQVASSVRRLRSLEKKILAEGTLSTNVESALRSRFDQFARILVAEKANRELSSLKPAEEKIVQAASEYVGLLRRQG